MNESTRTCEKRLCLNVERSEKFKAGLLSISAALPIDRDTTPLTTLLFSVLRRGTERYPTLEAINRRLDDLYGAELAIRNFYRGDVQIVGFSSELIDPSFLPVGEDPMGAVMEILCQILFHPLLDENGLLCEKYVESEKRLQCDAIRALKNNPRGYAAEQCRAHLYADEPCGAAVMGCEEEIMAVTPHELTAHWKRLLSLLRFDCFYIGAADRDAVLRVLENTLGRELQAVGLTERVAVNAVSCRTAQDREPIEEKLAVSQSQLLLAYRTPISLRDPAYYAMLVCNEMFGGSPVSRLFMNVRERLSLCYSCSSSFYSFKGVLMVQCGLHRDNRALAEREILKQMRMLQAGAFDDGELDAAKKSLLNTYRQMEDSPSAIESFFFGRMLAGLEGTPEDCRAQITQVSREDVIAAAQTLKLDTVYFLNGTLDPEEDVDEDED